MQLTTDRYKELIERPSRKFSARITVGTNIIEDGIRSIRTTARSNAEDSFMLGSVCSKYVEITMEDPGIYIENQDIKVEIGLSGEYLSEGLFKVGEISKEDGFIKLTACDNMMKTERMYTSALPENTSTKSVLSELSRTLGISITSPSGDYPIKKPVGYTIREVLSYISAMYGGFTMCDRDGNICIKTYQDTAYTVGQDRFWNDFVHQELNYSVQQIICVTGQDDEGNAKEIISGTGVRILQMSNPFMTPSRLDAVRKSLAGLKYMPGEVSFLGDNRIDPWDIISVTDKSGTSYKVPCMQIIQEYDGGLKTTAAAYGQSETEESMNYSGPNAQMYDRIVAKIGYFQKINAEKIEANRADITDLTADQAEIKNLLAGTGSFDNIGTIHLTTANTTIDEAVVKELIAGKLIAEDMTAFRARIEEINTDEVDVHSESGNSWWRGNTIQMQQEDGKPRVQIGEDAKGDYNLYLWDKDGNPVWDAQGLCEAAINRPVIKDSAIAKDANISGDKLDILSLMREINGNNEARIDSSRIWLDDKDNSLNVTIASMEKEQTDIKSAVGEYMLDVIVNRGQVTQSGGTDSSASMEARVYRSRYTDGKKQFVDITASFSDKEFRWKRRSSDRAGDDAWNAAGKTGKVLNVSAEDAKDNATFICEIYLEGTETSEGTGTSGDTEEPPLEDIWELEEESNAAYSDFVVIESGGKRRKITVGNLLKTVTYDVFGIGRAGLVPAAPAGASNAQILTAAGEWAAAGSYGQAEAITIEEIEKITGG